MCQAAGIPPVLVVLDFVDAVRTMELLPSAWIPAMVVQQRMPTPASSQPMVVGMECLKP